LLEKKEIVEEKLSKNKSKKKRRKLTMQLKLRVFIRK
jgi:hypothetical protein